LYRTNGKPVEGITIHRDVLSLDETLVIDRMPVTTAAKWPVIARLLGNAAA
jgi:hypothetical protein